MFIRAEPGILALDPLTHLRALGRFKATALSGTALSHQLADGLGSGDVSASAASERAPSHRARAPNIHRSLGLPLQLGLVCPGRRTQSSQPRRTDPLARRTPRQRALPPCVNPAASCDDALHSLSHLAQAPRHAGSVAGGGMLSVLERSTVPDVVLLNAPDGLLSRAVKPPTPALRGLPEATTLDARLPDGFTADSSGRRCPGCSTPPRYCAS